MALNCSSDNLAFSTSYFEIPEIPEFGYDGTNMMELDDYVGKENTEIFIKKGINLFPAARYCVNYLGYGKWFMPSFGELRLFTDNMSSVIADFNKAGISTNIRITESGRPFINYWTSTPAYYTSDNVHGKYAARIMVYGYPGYIGPQIRNLSIISGSDIFRVIPFTKI